MKYLIIDGNSIINRAFYGIKLLNAKDGHFTNAIYGFMNILLNLKEKYNPDAIISAFDVHQPTFRHLKYSEYKAGRKSPPPELLEQFDPLKKLLKAYGCHIVECPGYEADDILGTLSVSIDKDDHCYIATGDRDSLQLVKDNVTVLLTTTKMGQTHTVEYDKKQLFDEYGVSPAGMIEIKALQGDNSDNIPGVAGIGPKTAGELIRKYGTIDNIYFDLPKIEATKGVKAKLEAGKESAYFSRELGTICLNAPINTDMKTYLEDISDRKLLLSELARHEMFRLISKIGLEKDEITEIEKDKEKKYSLSVFNGDISELKNKKVYICGCFSDENLKSAAITYNDKIFVTYDSSLLLKIIGSDEIEKVTDDCKKIFALCIANDMEPKNVTFDITLASYLLDVNSSDYSIPALALSYSVHSCEAEGEDAQSVTFIENNKDLCKNATLINVLADRLDALINEREELPLLKDIEIPLAYVLSSMEYTGMKVDKKGIADYSELLSDKIENLASEIYSIAGEKFNINSPKQLGIILFEKLGLPAKKKTKTGYSTSADVLEGLAEDYPIVSKVLEYRTYSKLKSTYCDGLLKAVDSDDRIRSTFNQTETRTGRLSSTEPNLQNIPVRTPIGREMRKFFVSEDGYLIVDADYSQIELRVLAALSGDKNMTEAFNSGTDIHSVTASKVFGIPLENVTPELRSKAKAVNFGIVYGIGAFSLAKDIKSTRAEADSFIKSYLALYSSVDKYMTECISSAKEKGYGETLFKRRRYLPELTSSNGMIRAFGERVARNMPIQGTAADIIKIAMIRVFKRLKKEFPEAHLIMQVHDELMAEAPEKDAPAVAELIKEEMENAVVLSVKFIADTSYGKSWYDAKE